MSSTTHHIHRHSTMQEIVDFINMQPGCEGKCEWDKKRREIVSLSENIQFIFNPELYVLDIVRK